MSLTAQQGMANVVYLTAFTWFLGTEIFYMVSDHHASVINTLLNPVFSFPLD